MLSLVNGSKIEIDTKRYELAKIYSKACKNAGDSYSESHSRDDYYKIIYFWVKYLNLTCSISETTSIAYLQELFNAMEFVKMSIKELTPNELIRIFPIDKRFDGERYQNKDYFYTMEALNKHGLDNLIGEAIEHILWDYTNKDVCSFILNLFDIVGELHKSQTGRNLFDDFLDSQNVKLTTYKMAIDPKTKKQYIINCGSGKTMLIKKKIPRYLKPLKH